MGKMAFVSEEFGSFIGAYPLQTIISALTVCFLIPTVFLFKPFTIETDIRHGFAYRNSRSALEFQVMADNYSGLLIIKKS